MHNLLFEIIMSKDCNKRCPYCKLDFSKKNIDNKNLDLLINLLINSKEKINSCIINFFWWEPLLNIVWIKYFVEKTKHLGFIKYSIWTNWILLTQEKINYFLENNFKIYLSFDSSNTDFLVNKDFLKKAIWNIDVNYIINPNTIEKSYNDFEKIVKFWYTNINIMPVYFTIKWDKNSFISLKRLLRDKINKYLLNDIFNIKFYSYYNWVSTDIQYILETDWTLYSDLDSLLWIQKQWSIISKELSQQIEYKTKIWNISDVSLNNIINAYNIKDIIKLVHDIPKEQKFLNEYTLLNKILNG